MENLGEIVIFNNEDGEVKVQIDAVNETIWLSQKGMSELFVVSVPAINQHLKNIYEQEELKEEATIKKNLIVRQEGARQVSREVIKNLRASFWHAQQPKNPAKKKATYFRKWLFL